MTNAVIPPFFDNLPRYALPALQGAWDRASARQFGTKYIFTSFCKDLREIGVEPPTQPVMTTWITLVQKGAIARPERETPKATLAGDAASAGKVVDAVVTPAENAGYAPLSPASFKILVDDPASAASSPIEQTFTALYERMLAQAMAELQRDLRAQAHQMVADRIGKLILDADLKRAA